MCVCHGKRDRDPAVGFGTAAGPAGRAAASEPRRGGRRSTGCVLTHLCCMNCSVTDLAIKILGRLVRAKKSRRPRLRARACNRVFQKRSEARARAGLLRTLLCGELASPTISTEADRVFFAAERIGFFPALPPRRTQTQCSRAMGQLQAPFLSCRVVAQPASTAAFAAVWEPGDEQLCAKEHSIIALDAA